MSCSMSQRCENAKSWWSRTLLQWMPGAAKGPKSVETSKGFVSVSACLLPLGVGLGGGMGWGNNVLALALYIKYS